MKQVFRQLNLIFDNKQKRGIFLLFLGSLFVAVVDTLSVSLMAPFMTLLTDVEGNTINGTLGEFMQLFGEINSTIDMLKIVSVAFIFLYILRGACKILYNFYQAKLLALYRTELSVKLFSYVLHKPYAYHLCHNTAETQRLVSQDVANSFVLITSLMYTMSSGLVSLGIFTILLMMDWKLTVMLITIISLLLLFMKKQLKRFIKKMADANFLANSEMNKWVSQAIGGLKTILVKRRQNYYVEHYEKAAQNAAIANSNFIAVNGLPKVLIDTFCMVMVFSFVLFQIMTGNNVAENLPVFATFALAALRLVPVMGQVTETLNAMAYYRPSLNAIYETLKAGKLEQQITEQIEKKETEKRLGEKPMKLNESIQLTHITFRYGDMQTELFADLNLKIPAKKSVAFVGVTGAGKTTLADIILGLHQPTSGKILVDGHDIRKNPVGWARLIGYIPQFIYLCDGTIRANIALGDEKALIDDDWIWDCLERAQMKEFVESLPNGLDTITGENGIRLSGGQRQRIGIARALYNKPQFLLMDEATSSLDGETEKAIVDSIERLSGDLTLLIIAHRLSTIQNCDIIYRIEGGKAQLEKIKN